MNHKVQSTQVGTTTAVLGALAATGLYVAAQIDVRMPPTGWLAPATIWFGWWLWQRWTPPPHLEHDHDPAAQLDYWCGRIGISTPEILGHEYTDTGELYRLKVTGKDEDGYVMTPETFHGYWPKFRSVAGDNCRGIFISPPDRDHGGRCSMAVVWRAAENPDAGRWPVGVHLTASSIRWCYSDDDVRSAIDEANRNGTDHQLNAWAAPNPAERAGEG